MRRSYREFWFLPASVLQEILLTGQKFQLSTSNGSRFYMIFVQGCGTSRLYAQNVNITCENKFILENISLCVSLSYFKFIYCLLISASHFHPLDY